MCSSLEQAMWNPHLFQKGVCCIPVVLFCGGEGSIPCRSRKIFRHSHFTFSILHYTPLCCAEVQVASPSLSRSWARHPHLTTIYYALPYKGGGGTLTSSRGGLGTPISIYLTISYYTTYAVPSCCILSYSVPYHTVRYITIPYSAILYHTILYHTIL